MSQFIYGLAAEHTSTHKRAAYAVQTARYLSSTSGLVIHKGDVVDLAEQRKQSRRNVSRAFCSA